MGFTASVGYELSGHELGIKYAKGPQWLGGYKGFRPYYSKIPRTPFSSGGSHTPAHRRQIAARRKMVRFGKSKRPSYSVGMPSRYIVPVRGTMSAPHSRKKYIKSMSATNTRTGGFMGKEHKFVDSAWNGTAIDSSTDGADGEMLPTTGVTNCISAPAQGDGENQRDGRRYVLTDIEVTGMIGTSPNPNLADVTELYGYYFALVLDKQTNKAVIVSENVFVNPSTSGSAMLPYPLRNLENENRFEILDAKYIPPGGVYAGTDGSNTVSTSPMAAQRVVLKWSGRIPVVANGTTAAVSSVSDNSVHLIAYAGLAGWTPTFVGKARVRFYG